LIINLYSSGPELLTVVFDELMTAGMTDDMPSGFDGSHSFTFSEVYTLCCCKVGIGSIVKANTRK